MTTLLSRQKKKAPMARRRLLSYIGCAVIALGGAGVGLSKLVEYIGNVQATCVNQGVTVIMHDAAGQCVGVTDGSFPFDPGSKAMAYVEREILAENQRVTKSGSPYLSVAYLMPIFGGVEPIHTVIEQLAGAYAKQHDSNNAARAAHAAGTAGAAPLIQLLIASSGTQAAGYQTTDKVIEADVASQHLVAVAGIGVSLDSTITEVKNLTGYGIPVIGSSISSDAFNNIPKLVRVAPSNAWDVLAMLKYIKPQASTAVLVEDTNQTDSYDTTLVRKFNAGYLHHIVDYQPYDTTDDTDANSPDAQRVATAIGNMPANICAHKGSAVLFAGRGRDLATLIDDLGQNCARQPITIVTGDGVTDMPITPSITNALANGITLEYTGDANPDEWDTGTTPTDEAGRHGFALFDQAFNGQSPTVTDSDGIAMIGYDAMLTTIDAINRADTKKMTPADVFQGLRELHGREAVHGASGPINLSGIYQPAATSQGSNPIGKVVPILRLDDHGTPTFVTPEQPLL